MTLNRAITVENIQRKVYNDMAFEGKWLDAIGEPEMCGVWIIWGNSGNGKTSFALQLAKYLTQFGKVAYNSLEEGTGKSMKMAIDRTKMYEVSKQFMLISEDMPEMSKRLRKHKSPKIVIIDSFQFTGLTKPEYKQLKKEHSNKLLIFISHAEGKQPEGRPAKFVRYDAPVKIRIEGYKAFTMSRYGGGTDYIIWNEGAANYWSDITK